MKDLNYNLANLLTNRSHLCDSRYDEYIADAKSSGCESCAKLLEEMKKADESFIEALKEEIEEHVENGDWS